jgi:hypothetical protein
MAVSVGQNTIQLSKKRVAEFRDIVKAKIQQERASKV